MKKAIFKNVSRALSILVALALAALTFTGAGCSTYEDAKASAIGRVKDSFSGDDVQRAKNVFSALEKATSDEAIRKEFALNFYWAVNSLAAYNGTAVSFVALELHCNKEICTAMAKFFHPIFWRNQTNIAQRALQSEGTVAQEIFAHAMVQFNFNNVKRIVGEDSVLNTFLKVKTESIELENVFDVRMTGWSYVLWLSSNGN